MLCSAGAARTEPRLIDWSHVDKNKWEFPETSYGGHMSYSKDPEYEEGTLIRDGIQKLKNNPDLYDGILFQTSMKTWPEDQQKHKLVKRTGSGFNVGATGEGFSYIEAKYQVLSADVDDPDQYDEYTDSVLDTFSGDRLGAPLFPGRGKGCADVPGLCIFADVDPDDVAQGGVGDCWMLSAISGLAEFDGAVHRLFRKTKKIKNLPGDAFNTYTVTLFDLPSGEEVDIVVDERLCSKPDGKSLLGNTASVEGELWVCYLEKALAAHCGGWDEIDGGQPVHAWRLMTGCKDQYTFSDPDGDGFVCLGFPDNADIQNSPHKGCQSMHYVPWPEVGSEDGDDCNTKLGHHEFFERMAIWDSNNYILGAGTCCGSDTSDHQGIVDGHAYTVMTCIVDVAGSGFDLVKVRNPWGKGEFTSGEWDDDGPGWDKHPEVRDALQPVDADNGVFWLSSDEFFKYFQTVYVCAHDMSEFLEK